jgi:hypothetical protein
LDWILGGADVDWILGRAGVDWILGRADVDWIHQSSLANFREGGDES